MPGMGIPCGDAGGDPPSNSGEYAGASPMDRDPSEDIERKCTKCKRLYGVNDSKQKRDWCRNFEFNSDGWYGITKPCQYHYDHLKHIESFAGMDIDDPNDTCTRCEGNGYIYSDYFIFLDDGRPPRKRSCPECQEMEWMEKKPYGKDNFVKIEPGPYWIEEN